MKYILTNLPGWPFGGFQLKPGSLLGCDRVSLRDGEGGELGLGSWRLSQPI